MRNRLIELLEDTLQEWECDVSDKTISEIAEHLLANGVVCPPCKVGDKLYIFYSSSRQIEELEVASITFRMFHDVIEFTDNSSLTIWNKDYNALFGKRVFLTKEEAEKALKGSVQE